MKRRTYGQYCGLAQALDLIGERWTALVIRDLATSPRRFNELLAGLSGLGTSLLSERLRHLEDIGLVERAVQDRAAGGGVVYRLTGEGDVVARALGPLTRWGATRLDEEIPAEGFRPDWLLFLLRSSVAAEAATDLDDCYEFRLHGATFWVLASGGAVTVTTERPRPPDFVATLDLPTLAALGSGLRDPAEVVASGDAVFEGDLEAGRRALRLLGGVD